MVDFAYHVHTDVGNQMFAAKINGNVVHAGHAVANAEVVEVLTYDGAPSRGSLARHQVLWFPANPSAMCSRGLCAPLAWLLRAWLCGSWRMSSEGSVRNEQQSARTSICSCCSCMASSQLANNKHTFCRSGRATRAQRRRATSLQSS